MKGSMTYRGTSYVFDFNFFKEVVCVLFANIYLKPFNVPFWEDEHLEKI